MITDGKIEYNFSVREALFTMHTEWLTSKNLNGYLWTDRSLNCC